MMQGPCPDGVCFMIKVVLTTLAFALPATAAMAFPVTVEHAYGPTQIDAEPERVVALGWGTTEALLALGVLPVAIPSGETIGGDENDLLPWVAQYLAANGLERPAILPHLVDEPPYELILAQDPDLILAPYSGYTEAEYDRLSAIAPTIVHPDVAWGTPWRDVIRMSGAALGLDDKAEEVLAGLDAKVADVAAAHPEFQGLSIAFVEPYEGQLLVYTAHEPRAAFLEDLGLVVDSFGSSEHYIELSAENAGSITSDIVLMNYPDEASRIEFEASAAAALMPQFAEGRVASVVGAANVAAVAYQTALSLPYIIEPLADSISEAARHVGK